MPVLPSKVTLPQTVYPAAMQLWRHMSSDAAASGSAAVQPAAAQPYVVISSPGYSVKGLQSPPAAGQALGVRRNTDKRTHEGRYQYKADHGP